MSKEIQNIQKGIFITGIFRSGTTLLARSLSAHPKITVAYQLFFPFFKMWQDLFFEQNGYPDSFCAKPMGSDIFFNNSLFNKFSQSGNTVYFSQRNIDELESLLTRDLERDRYEKPLFPEGTFSGLSPGSSGEILFQLINKIRVILCDNKEIIGLKEIWCEDFIPVLLNIKEMDFRCIQILRDPRAIFASRNSGRYLQECGGKKYPLLFIVESWLRSVRIAVKFQNRQFFYMVSYEDFVQRPRDMIESVCSFLGIDFHIDMIKPEKFTDGRGNLWKPNTTGNNFSHEFNEEPLVYWQKVLTDKEIGSIEFLCGKEMQYSGYQRVFSDKLAYKFFMEYQEKEDEIQSWLASLKYVCNKEKKIEFLHLKGVYEN